MKKKPRQNQDETISLTPISWTDYNYTYAQIRRAPLLQSYCYAKTARLAYTQKSIPFAINYNGKSAGIFCMQEVSMMGKAIHGVILDRGPLWFNEDGKKARPSSALHHGFWQELNGHFPRRFGRRRRILPEIEYSQAYHQTLEGNGFRKLSQRQGYQTIWLNLEQDKQTLRAGLHGKWRNALKKAEKSDFDIKWGHTMNDAALILARSEQDKKARKYQSTSLKTLSVLSGQASATGDLFVGKATKQGHVIAGVILIKHGTSATYQIGWNSLEARAMNANYRLLWEGIQTLKEAGVLDVDLGGVNDQDATGVKKFKSGLGGEHITLIGQYK